MCTCINNVLPVILFCLFFHSIHCLSSTSFRSSIHHQSIQLPCMYHLSIHSFVCPPSILSSFHRLYPFIHPSIIHQYIQPSIVPSSFHQSIFLFFHSSIQSFINPVICLSSINIQSFLSPIYPFIFSFFHQFIHPIINAIVNLSSYPSTINSFYLHVSVPILLLKIGYVEIPQRNSRLE